jgi:hypothetical protein
VIHPSLVWLNGQGFPKATRIDTQIDKAAGAERPDRVNGGHIGVSTHGGDGPNENEHGLPHIIGKGDLAAGTPILPLAATWQGHRYGLQALKPCAEFILVAQKPYAGKPVESIVSTGAGALWIDGGRVATGENLNGGAYSGNTPKLIKQIYGEYNKLRPEDYQQPQGRWPPNVCLTHAEGCKRVGTRRVKGSSQDTGLTDTPARSWKNERNRRGVGLRGRLPSQGAGGAEWGEAEEWKTWGKWKWNWRQTRYL